jgi:hypothetical protein
VRKTLQGRYHFLRAVWSHGPLLHACAATAVHAAAALRDLLAMACGRERSVIRRRGDALPDALRDQWSRLLAQLDASGS